MSAATDAQRPSADDVWHRLSPFSPLVPLGRVTAALFALAVPALVEGGSFIGLVFYVPATAILLVSGFVKWRVTRWRVRGAVLEKEEGLIRRNSLRFPLTQVQAIDIVRPGVARLFGLAELRLRTGGSTHTSARLAYLRAADAAGLRARLLRLAHAGSDAGTDAVEEAPPERERVIVTTPTGRLLAGLALSHTSLPLIVGLAVATRFVGLGAGVIAYLLAVAASAWRRFNNGYHLTVAEGHDGLRLHSGLVATNAETIRRGRVQAVKVVEPLLWRPFGWCALQVDIAGRQRSSGESASQRRAARTLLSVGSRRQADELLDYLVPDSPTQRLPPPKRARLKTPLRYRNLSWGRTDRCVVATGGLFTRVTSWVPLEKVQSIRRVEGPVQRRLRLVTIHVDTAGRGVRAALRDRDRSEADAALAELVTLCRRARQPA